MPSLIIRSGGQSGVDRAALDVARARGIAAAGWCPRGGWAEDRPVAPGLLIEYPFLAETPSSQPEQRTAWNVRDSHCTLVLSPRDLETSAGTRLTRNCAELIFVRPFLALDLAEPSGVDLAAKWMAEVVHSLRLSILVLNVAGPRESEVPGIQARAADYLDAILTQFQSQANHS